MTLGPVNRRTLSLKPMTYIPGISQPIPGTPIYNVTSTEDLESNQWPMVYTTDGPLQVGNGISFTTDSISFDPTLVDGGIVQQIVAGTNISISPANGKGVVTVSATGGTDPPATPTTLGTVYGFYDSAKANVGFGQNVLQAATTGSSLNLGVGVNNLDALTTGQRNTALGVSAGGAVTTGSRNTMVGATAGIALTTANNNTLVGASAGGGLTTGSGNALLGYQAGLVLTTGSNNTLVGGYQGAATITNQTILSDGAGNIRLWINNNGAIGVGTGASYGTSGQILTSGGAAAAPTWANPAAQNITGVIPGTNTPTTIYTTTIPSGGTFSAWGYLTVYSNQDIIKTYTVSFLNTYNSFSGMAGPGGVITAGASYTNPVLPEPAPSIVVQYQTGQGGGIVTLYATAQNGAFNFSLTLFRTV